MTTAAATDNSRKGGEDHGGGSARTGQRRELRGSVRRSRPCRPRRRRRVGAQASPQARAATGTADGNADPRIEPCRRRRCRRVGAKHPRRLGRVAFERTRTRANPAGSSAKQAHPIESGSYRRRCPEGVVQSAALDARQRAHARYPARRVRIAIAGPGTATGARCAAACASTPGSGTAAVVDREAAPGGAGSHAATGCVSAGRLVGSVVGARRAPPNPGRRRHSRIPAGARRACGGQTTSFVSPCAGSCPTPTSGSASMNSTWRTFLYGAT